MIALVFIDTDEYQIDTAQTTGPYVAYAIDATEYVGGIKLLSYNMLYGGQPPNPLTVNLQLPKKDSFRFCNTSKRE